MSAPSRLSRFAWFTVAYTVGVILFGAWVRITGSGAGCGQHWPTCHGQVLPRAASTQTLIEFTHRVTSGLDGLLVLALAIAATRLLPRGHAARRYAWWSVVLLVVEALLGAGLVLFELVENDASLGRVVMMPVHLTNTLLLLGAMALTAHTAAGHSPPRFWGSGVRGRLAGAALLATLVVSQLGALTALGDTVFPVLGGGLLERLAEADASTSHVLERLRFIHPLVAVAVSALLWRLPALLQRPDRPQALRPWDQLLMVTVGVQLLAGLVNVLLSAPGWMQLVHLALADAVWLVLVLLCAAATSEPIDRYQSAR